MPWQQFVEAALRQIGDAGQDVGEPRLGIDVIHLGRDDQAVYDSGSLTTPVRPGEELGLAAQGNCPSILPMELWRNLGDDAVRKAA